MQFRFSLRYRVGLAFSLLGALVSLFLAIGLYIASHDLEERLIDETLTAELEDYIARRDRNPQSLPQATATIRGYVLQAGAGRDTLPVAIRALQPGRHAVLLNGIPYRAVVADRDSERIFVLYNESRLRRRERGFVAFLGGGVAIMALLSAAVGIWLAGRVISPVTELARRVTGMRPEDHPASLEEDFPHDEVGELAQAVDGYMARLSAFMERERAFTADVSHELRTPLAVIHGAAEVLLADPQLNDGLRGRVLRVARSAQEMREVTEALLVLGREADAAQSARPVSCRVREVVSDVVEKNRELFHAKPVEVETRFDVDLQLPVERALLAVVVGNLVRNAFAYTEKGHIRVTVESERISVADTGPGIGQDALEKVFTRYFRGPTSAGSGIGLSLVKRICDRYGWRIDAKSNPGEGTVMGLEFPPEKKIIPL